MEINPLHTVKEIEVISSLWAEKAGEKKVNKLLASGEWFIISTSSGTDIDGHPMHEWVLGKI
ncbi:hypothetical protein [Yersinia aldovae]|uniref:hypothetical protein n=1 Tax=Yersinia phage vB_YenM_324 TaxID=2914024 RepID=UPI00119FFB6C|nr:hypothetical protein [Yersinia aldovae]YP_010664398.1 hypothetical protein PQA69_gp39 [Yersinia phage vB_YenM_324]UKL54226.1 hypothetical protein vBYenM324_039 [Yersinia phage vB_YenM_324]HDL6647134.1 hypothetical protein [Yersinia enterocolitica]HDL7737415.1 hypothetical protein [Yersinia enterocolitica]